MFAYWLLCEGRAKREGERENELPNVPVLVNDQEEKNKYSAHEKQLTVNLPSIRSFVSAHLNSVDDEKQ